MFVLPKDAARDTDERIHFLFTDICAIDTERNLALTTTYGRTRNARRWFVEPLIPGTLKKDRSDYDRRVVFRAWTLEEAMEKANTDTRTVNRIAKVFAPAVE